MAKLVRHLTSNEEIVSSNLAKGIFLFQKCPTVFTTTMVYLRNNDGYPCILRHYCYNILISFHLCSNYSLLDFPVVPRFCPSSVPCIFAAFHFDRPQMKRRSKPKLNPKSSTNRSSKTLLKATSTSFSLHFFPQELRPSLRPACIFPFSATR